MTVSISERTRRKLGIAACNRDAADSYCDALESRANASNADDQYLHISLADLAAGDDLVDYPLVAFDVAVVVTNITLVAEDVFAGIDAGNTMAVTVKDGGGNTIVTKTYDDTTVPVDNGPNDLGALDSTHKKLAANGLCKISVTNGTTADPPAMTVLLTFHVGTS